MWLDSLPAWNVYRERVHQTTGKNSYSKRFTIWDGKYFIWPDLDTVKLCTVLSMLKCRTVLGATLEEKKKIRTKFRYKGGVIGCLK